MVAVASTLAARFSWAAGALAGAKPQYGTAITDLGFPSIGRVVLGFLLTVGLAVGVAFGVRRFWPLLLRQQRASSRIRAIDRTTISPTLTLHVVEVEGARMLIAEGRSGVALTPLSSPRDGGP